MERVKEVKAPLHRPAAAAAGAVVLPDEHKRQRGSELKQHHGRAEDALLPAGEREENVPCDLNDTEWFRRIDASGGAIFFAAGVFYYFSKEQVRALVLAMAETFPGGMLVFDAANKRAVKLMLKTWIKDAEIQDVGAYFSVSDARKEIGAWSGRLRISSRGYMLGYNKLKDPSIPAFFRSLARVGDEWMQMQIVQIGFVHPEDAQRKG